MRTRANPGDWRAFCEVCGFTRRYKASEMRQRWDKKMVCPDDWEERQPLDFVKTQVEDFSVPWANATSIQSTSADYTTQPEYGGAVDHLIISAIRPGAIIIGWEIIITSGQVAIDISDPSKAIPFSGFPTPTEVTLIVKQGG